MSSVGSVIPFITTRDSRGFSPAFRGPNPGQPICFISVTEVRRLHRIISGSVACERPVLIVEDDRDQREGMAELLESSDIPVLTASTLEEALAHIKEEKFVDVLSDGKYPHIAGGALYLIGPVLLAHVRTGAPISMSGVHSEGEVVTQRVVPGVPDASAVLFLLSGERTLPTQEMAAISAGVGRKPANIATLLEYFITRRAGRVGLSATS